MTTSSSSSLRGRDRRTRLLLPAVLAALALSACSPAAPVAGPDDPPTSSGTPTEAADGGATAGTGEVPPLFGDDDLLFLEAMTLHHEQALEMAALVPARTDRDELVRYAEDVEQAQGAELELMETYMADASEERGGAVPHGDHAHEHEHDMLSDADIADLAQASGEEFERLWLEGMIRHHEGALRMAEEQLDAGSLHLGLADLAHHVIEEQQYEIGLMQRWLREWGLEG